MRIAVCLSGQPRTWRHTHASLFRFFSGQSVDVFIHTWAEIDPGEWAAITDVYSPKDVLLEPRPLFVEEKRVMAEKFPVSPPFSVFDMFHSISQSIRLAIDRSSGAQVYDLVCRSRFDLIHDGIWNGSAPLPGTLSTPPVEIDNGLNDQFALADIPTMAAYSGITEWLPAALESLDAPVFRPEIALHHYITKVCSITTFQEAYPVKLLRPDQLGLAFAQITENPMFHAVKREEWEAFARQHLNHDLVKGLNFDHYSKTPLALDRWLSTLPAETRQTVLRIHWPQRIRAIDRLINDKIQSNAVTAADYPLVRLLCAALIHRMDRDEPMTPESFVVHALSANYLDMRRAQAWLQEDSNRKQTIVPALAEAPLLYSAIKFAPPLDQKASMGWRIK